MCRLFDGVRCEGSARHLGQREAAQVCRDRQSHAEERREANGTGARDSWKTGAIIKSRTIWTTECEQNKRKKTRRKLTPSLDVCLCVFVCAGHRAGQADTPALPPQASSTPFYPSSFFRQPCPSWILSLSLSLSPSRSVCRFSFPVDVSVSIANNLWCRTFSIPDYRVLKHTWQVESEECFKDII